MIELLAPAKDKICALAAIDSGADAVYIGASDFGARKNVPNTIEDIQDIVEYAHKFNVKVYVAINTILTDKELSKAAELVKKLATIGVDALIVQDMGLLQALRTSDSSVSSLPLHASTQCDNRSISKVGFLKNVGFSRVVLARELSLEQIKEIKNKVDVELEVFIHGALCVSYSGQCYMSQAIGGRSANRGECAQPCRKKYSLIDEDGNYIEKNKHLLCLKDFNASKYIKELADIGVTSLKIEGRLKDANYVRNVVSYYRKLIDDLGLQKSSSGNIILDFAPDLEKSFNRGFTDYFLKTRSECYSFDTPKARGEYLGKVTKVGQDFFEIASEKTINAQDGLCYFSEREFGGCLVNKALGNKIFPNKLSKIEIGTKIYRNLDVDFEKKLKTSETKRKISIDIEFHLNSIKAVDEDKHFAEINYQYEDFAQNEEKMLANIENQLKKAGESMFFVQNVKILSDKIPFLPISKLNELRRKLFEKLEKQRIADYKRQEICNQEITSVKPYTNSALDYRANILNQSAKKFYESLGFEVSEMAMESGLRADKKVVMTTKHCLKHAFNMCQSKKKLYLIDEKGKRYELKFNCEKCEMEIIF